MRAAPVPQVRFPRGIGRPVAVVKLSARRRFRAAGVPVVTVEGRGGGRLAGGVGGGGGGLDDDSVARAEGVAHGLDDDGRVQTRRDRLGVRQGSGAETAADAAALGLPRHSATRRLLAPSGLRLIGVERGAVSSPTEAGAARGLAPSGFVRVHWAAVGSPTEPSAAGRMAPSRRLMLFGLA